MKVVITPRAQVQYDNQLRYGIARHGERTALRTFARVNESLSNTIALFPHFGGAIAERGLYARQIPRTPFVVVYRIDERNDVVDVIGFYHHAQDREGEAEEP